MPAPLLRIGVFAGVLVLAGCTAPGDQLPDVAQATHYEGGALFENKCAGCHAGAIPSAPNVEALQLLPAEAIVTSLQSGSMQVQGAALTPEQHEQIAGFLTQNSVPQESMTGLCASEVLQTASTNTLHPDWGMGLENRRYVDGDRVNIHAGNVPDLKLSWVFAFPNASRARAQPTLAGNTLFTADQHGSIYALDRSTGCIQWTFQADAEVRSAVTIGVDQDQQPNRLYFGDFSAQVYALDLETRELLWKVKVDDHPVATITGSVSLFEDQLFVPVSSLEIVSAIDPAYPCCTFQGSVVALNLETGEVNWKTSTIEDKPTEHGTNSIGTPRYAASGAPVWSRPTIDALRRVLYVGTGENYSRPASGTSDAIIAMSLDTGEIAWVHQAIPQDAWNGACMVPDHPNCPEDTGPDADFGAPPILVNNGEQDIILAGQKSGTVYALDPDLGTLLWEKTVGKGGIMGGVHWGMATDSQTLYVPINDRGEYALHEQISPAPGLHALSISDGTSLWSTIETDRCGEVDWSCGPGLSAAITATPDLVFAGTLDGWIKAYSASTGKELWTFDTNRTFDAVNGVYAFGGTIDSDGPVLAGNQLFITSGYAKFNEKAGNVLLAFALPQ